MILDFPHPSRPTPIETNAGDLLPAGRGGGGVPEAGVPPVLRMILLKDVVGNLHYQPDSGSRFTRTFLAGEKRFETGPIGNIRKMPS
jgi:hypothetical protein